MKQLNSILLPLFGFVGSQLFVHGATLVWTNTSGGDWTVAANWDPHQVPGLADKAIITNAGTYNINLSGGTEIADFTLGTPSGPGTQTLTMLKGGFFTSGVSGVINSNGVFNFDPGGSWPLSGSALSILVSGTLNWSSGPLASLLITPTGALGILSPVPHVVSTTLTNRGTVRWMGGSIRVDLGYTIENEGRWVAKVPDEIQAGIPPSPIGASPSFFNNRGRFEVLNGIVNIQSGGASSGTFDVATNATCQFVGEYNFNSGTAFTGAGTNRLGSGFFRLYGSISSQNLELADGQLLGSCTLKGNINWVGSKLVEQHSLPGGASSTTIGVGSTLNIISSQPHDIGGHDLINLGEVRWTGGRIGFVPNRGYPLTGIINRGRWVARVTNEIVNLYSMAHFSNQGTFEVAEGTVTMNDVPGTTPDSIISLAAGTRLIILPPSLGDRTYLYSGLLTGSGTLQTPHLFSWDVIRPGQPGAVLTIDGDFEQGTSGKLEIDLDHTGHSQLKVTGSADLLGALRPRSPSGFSPSAGARYEVLTAARRFGAFSRVDAIAGLGVNYSSTGVFLSTSVPGTGQIVSPHFAPNRTISPGDENVSVPGSFRFEFNTLSNQIYNVQSATDLANPTWISTTNLRGTGSLLKFTTILTNPPQRYFRVLPVTP